MKNLLKAGMLGLGIFLYMSCSTQSAVKPDELAKLQAENQSLKDQLGTKDAQIDALNEKLTTISAENSAEKGSGDQYDKIIKGLQDQLAADKMKLSRTEDALSITFLDSVFFGEGSAEITAGGMKSLDKVLTVLKTVKDKIIRVEGYADNVPIKDSYKWKYPSNWELSTARADAIVRYFELKGIDPDHLKAAGYGKFNPVAPNDTEAGRAQNRRIVVELVPLDVRAWYK